MGQPGYEETKEGILGVQRRRGIDSLECLLARRIFLLTNKEHKSSWINGLHGFLEQLINVQANDSNFEMS